MPSRLWPEAVTKIFDFYNSHNPDLAQFRLTMKPPILLTVDVFKALLCHALRPSSVAKNFWEFLEPHFNDALKEHGDPTDSQSLILIPHNGEWTTVENKLLEFRELNLDALTKEMNSHACAWITGLLLPSTFLFPIAFERG